MKKMTFFRKIIPVFVKISKKAQKRTDPKISPYRKRKHKMEYIVIMPQMV